MSLVWRKEMCTGLEWQDIQHKQMFIQIDQLLEAMEQNAGSSVVKGLIAFLEDYTRTHFMVEEDYMLTHDCKSYEAHKQCHESFIQNLSEIVELYDKQGASTVVVMRLQSWLREWLINHIMDVDKKMLSACTV